jgi:hypothetical protein
MGRHSLEQPADSSPVSESAQPRRPEPVAIAAAVQAVLAAAVAVGWVTLDNAAIATIGTAVAAVASIVVTIITRSKVTPTADPKM